jgi:predicted ATP-grasp superfamily ATP-dependent carboligase
MDGGWLIKRRHSAGGQHVRRWDGTATKERRATHYFQARIEGTPCSAVYVMAGRQARLLGATEQLIGAPWAKHGAFRYAGSVGPLECPATLTSSLTRIGEALGELELVGLIGVDFILNERGAWPIEINPRFTASVEILERACDFSSVRWHVAACRDGTLPPALSVPPLPPTRQGKAMLFADRELSVTSKLSEMLLERSLDSPWPEIADIPAADTIIQPGWPILTAFAAGNSNEEVKQALHVRLAEVREFVYGGKWQ